MGAQHYRQSKAPVDLAYLQGGHFGDVTRFSTRKETTLTIQGLASKNLGIQCVRSITLL